MSNGVTQMSNFKKTMMAAAGGAGGLDIPDVFSTYLYSGNSSAQTITNGIDLAGEGGLWWLKVRSQAGSHALYDSTRATGSEHFPLFSNATNAEYDDFDTTPTSTGFTINSTSSGTVNETGQDYVSWTWRKAPKFCDIVEYTGNNTARTISHNLGTTPGLIICKAKNSGGNWKVWHRSLSNGASGVMNLNRTDAETSNTTVWNNTLPTDTVFSLGTSNQANETGLDFVAYLFAHNDGDGEFGPDSDADIIKCGSYVGDDQDDGPEIDLGFEPQWLLVKNASSARNWVLVDNMRGIVTGGTDANLYPNTTSAEDPANGIRLTPTGFKCDSGGDNFNGNGHTMIYMAIRGGQLAVPEDADDVFAIDTRTAVSSISGTDASFYAGFAPDMALWRTVDTTANNLLTSRLTQSKLMYTNLDNAETSSTNGAYYFDKENGWFSLTSSDSDSYSWMWRRAPGFFDVLCYTGTGANRTIQHNLNASPDMIWLKSRETVSSSNDWIVYSSAFSNPTDTNITLNSSGGQNTGSGAILWNSTAPTDSTFSLGTYNGLNQSGKEYIAYLFSTLAGVSKIGSYAGSNSDQTIDCGFTAGARFVLIKNISRSSDWIVLDSVRGIVSGTDPFLRLNDNTSQNSAADYIDPDNSGFIVTGANSPTNQSGDNYIFYAIA